MRSLLPFRRRAQESEWIGGRYAFPAKVRDGLLREIKEAHFRDWVDTPIPALGGKTPRAAARAAKSREQLDLLLRDMENSESRVPEAARFDIGKLRRELGLEG